MYNNFFKSICTSSVLFLPVISLYFYTYIKNNNIDLLNFDNNHNINNNNSNNNNKFNKN